MARTQSSGLQRVHVLVVDDDRHMRHLLRLMLYGLGVGRVREAPDAAEAFVEMRGSPPDIILVDWMMSPLDGIDFVRLVRNAKDSRNPYIPLIMVTGHTEPRYVREARDAGVTEFLAKPVSAMALARRIAAVIHEPRPFIRTATYFGPDRRRQNKAFNGPDKRRGPHIAPSEPETPHLAGENDYGDGNGRRAEPDARYH
jgi:two-component system, chemotaxis family, chemotaxis protein CheY